MRNISAKNVAFAGVFSALQLSFVLLGFYLHFLTLTFNFLAGLTLLTVLALTGKRYAVVSYIAVGLLAFAFTGAGCIPYVVFFGFFTIVSTILREYNAKWYVFVPVIIVISSLVFFLCYHVFTFIAIDFTKLGFEIPYFVLSILFTAICFAYYFAIFEAYKLLRERFGKYFNH